MKPLLIIGSGGHAKMIISTALAAGRRIAAVLDDNRERWGQHVLGHEVSGPIAQVERLADLPAVIAIGNGAVRRRIAQEWPRAWATLIHPHAFVDPTAKIGEGTVIAAGAVVQPDAVIGRHAVLNTGASVDHDCRLGDFVTTGPGAHLSGNVTVGDGVLLGVGCCVKPGVQIGQETTVGAGAAVVRDLPPHVVAYGVPARVSDASRSHRSAA
jgi:sugar O-acyltransferase (sialic acid O-acetyltransferase NeuD family)